MTDNIDTLMAFEDVNSIWVTEKRDTVDYLQPQVSVHPDAAKGLEFALDRLAKCISSDIDRIRELETEAKEAWDAADALDVKLASIVGPNKDGDGMATCGCSYDHKDDVCATHSPKLEAAEAKVKDLEAFVYVMKQTAQRRRKDIKMYSDWSAALRIKVEQRDKWARAWKQTAKDYRRLSDHDGKRIANLRADLRFMTDYAVRLGNKADGLHAQVKELEDEIDKRQDESEALECEIGGILYEREYYENRIKRLEAQSTNNPTYDYLHDYNEGKRHGKALAEAAALKAADIDATMEIERLTAERDHYRKGVHNLKAKLKAIGWDGAT